MEPMHRLVAALTSRLAAWWVHTVTVQPKLGSSGYGDKFDTAVTVPCNVEDATRLVRDADGNEAVSSATVRCDLQYSKLFPLGSLVTLTWSARPRRVIGVHRQDSAGRSNLDHLEIHLA